MNLAHGRWLHLILYALEKTSAGMRGNRMCLRTQAQQAKIGRQCAQFFLTRGAALQMSAYPGQFFALKVAHAIQSEILLRDMYAAVHACKAFLRLIKPERIRVFTVPKGCPVRSAISV